MLYWYSGTGNSKFVAEQIAKTINDSELKFIPDEVRKLHAGEEIKIGKEATLGFCFPVYSWGIPPVVLDFIDSIPAEIFRDKYIYCILTCGDEAGLAAEMFCKHLNKRGVKANSLFTVIMPNDYVMLPGFDIDAKSLQHSKVEKAIRRIEEIACHVRERESIEDVFRGSWPKLKTRIVYPLFKKWGVQTSRWKVDADKCISCGKCASVCPAINITLKENKIGKILPVWGKKCYSCTACFHYCPERAIDYGSFTKRKKQYHFSTSLLDS